MLAWSQINKKMFIIFNLVHVITLYLIVTLPFKAEYILMAVGVFYFRWAMLSFSFHRYFAHRVCKTSRGFQFVLALFGTLSMVRGPLTFAAGHRLHHREADTEHDLHSIHAHSFMYTYLGWVMNTDYDETKIGNVKDLARFPELRYLTKYYYVPNLIVLYFTYAFFGLGVMTWAGLVSVLLTWHIAFCTTILFHYMGSRDYDTKDHSRNSFILNLFTLGEGWHNNHHYNMNSARMGHKWWQIDPGYWFFLALEKLGLVWSLNVSTERGKGFQRKVMQQKEQAQQV